MRRRIWCEFLPAEELGAASTVALLRRFRLEPLVALPPAAQTPEMGRALAALSRAGVPVGLWPLLTDEAGYWPSEANAAAFCDRVADALAFADGAGASVTTVAFDLEPPLDEVRELLDSRPWRAGRRLLIEARLAATPARRDNRRDAITRLSSLAASLHAEGIETIAAVVPHVVLDLAVGSQLWQTVLRTPVVQPGFTAVSAMLYTSMLVHRLPALREVTARAAVYGTGRALAGALGSRASLSLGLVGVGKLGNEPVLASPAALRADVEVARAAGVDDLALFSLEGALVRGRPEEWFAAFTDTPARAPRSRAVRAAAAAFGRLARGL